MSNVEDAGEECLALSQIPRLGAPVTYRHKKSRERLKLRRRTKCNRCATRRSASEKQSSGHSYDLTWRWRCRSEFEFGSASCHVSGALLSLKLTVALQVPRCPC